MAEVFSYFEMNHHYKLKYDVNNQNIPKKLFLKLKVLKKDIWYKCLSFIETFENESVANIVTFKNNNKLVNILFTINELNILKKYMKQKNE